MNRLSNISRRKRFTSLALRNIGNQVVSFIFVATVARRWFSIFNHALASVATKSIVLTILVAFPVQAEVRLPGFFNDHMVLQQSTSVPIWGWGMPDETVTVTFAGQTQNAAVDKFGSWMVRLEPLKASARGRSFRVNDLTIHDVVVGEVWICSGMTPMDWPLRKAANSPKEIAAANYPGIRVAAVNRVQSPLPENNAQADWQPCSPESTHEFSAVGYFFARRLHQELGIPIGIIGASWGGTPINPWIPAEGFRDTPELKWALDRIYGGRPESKEGKQAWAQYLRELEAWLPKAQEAVANKRIPTDRPAIPTKLWITNIVPTKTFNGMIHPLIPYAICGVIWDQGEADMRRPEEYYHKHRALIRSWRKLWQQDFSFYYVQFANFGKPNLDPEGGDGWAALRDVQRRLLAVERTGMAVTIDLGDPNSPQYNNKQDVGTRLALWALAKDYGRNDLVYSGPLFRDMEIKGQEAQLRFEHTGGGLVIGTKDALTPVRSVEVELKGFAICGADKVWHWADARIAPDRRSVILSSENVASPVAARYGYRGDPSESNLYNQEGLPTSPFKTDNL